MLHLKTFKFALTVKITEYFEYYEYFTLCITLYHNVVVSSCIACSGAALSCMQQRPFHHERSVLVRIFEEETLFCSQWHSSWSLNYGRFHCSVESFGSDIHQIKSSNIPSNRGRSSGRTIHESQYKWFPWISCWKSLSNHNKLLPHW